MCYFLLGCVALGILYLWLFVIPNLIAKSIWSKNSIHFLGDVWGVCLDYSYRITKDSYHATINDLPTPGFVAFLLHFIPIILIILAIIYFARAFHTESNSNAHEWVRWGWGFVIATTPRSKAIIDYI